MSDKKNLCSTRTHLILENSTPSLSDIPSPPLSTSPSALSTNAAFYKYVNGNSFGDLPGKFHVHSSKFKKYMLLVYNVDTNAILVKPLKSHDDANMTKAFQNIIKRLRKYNHKVTFFKLDNEVSQAVKDTLTDKSISFKLAPPHMH